MEHKRESFIFYRSFFEAIVDLPRDIQGEVYTAIMEYSLNGITTENLKPVARSIFTLIRPQLDANCVRYENGKKGGAPIGNSNNINGRKGKNQPKTNLKPTKNQPNVNGNVNVNELVEVDRRETENSTATTAIIPDYKQEPGYIAGTKPPRECANEAFLTYGDALCMELLLPNHETLKTKLQEFVSHLESESNDNRAQTDFNRHFKAWMRKRLSVGIGIVAKNKPVKSKQDYEAESIEFLKKLGKS